jgi:hypothetical protein
MSAVFGFEKRDVRIRDNFLPCLRKDSDKRVVGRVQDERGHGDAIHNICRGRTRVIVDGAGKTALVSGDLIVEFAQSAYPSQTGSFENFREQSRL